MSRLVAFVFLAWIVGVPASVMVLLFGWRALLLAAVLLVAYGLLRRLEDRLQADIESVTSFPVGELHPQHEDIAL